MAAVVAAVIRWALPQCVLVGGGVLGMFSGEEEWMGQTDEQKEETGRKGEGKDRGIN